MNKLIFLTLIYLVTNFSSTSFACTGISLRTSKNEIIQARTIEWGEFNLNSKLVISPANNTYTTILPDKSKGISWKSKYGFVGISVSQDNFIGEGVNEVGLSAGIFFFKGYGSLTPYDSLNKESTLVDMDFVRWILSNFRTVDEMIDNINKIKMVAVYLMPDGEPSPTGHWRVADKTGKNIVIEIINHGELHVYDNIGVVTNSPDYPWQLTNLGNYVNIESGTVSSKNFGSYTAKALGAGTSSIGLPGDITPPSRFVRAAFLLFNSPIYDNTSETVGEAFHILNNFDIPIGIEFGPDQRSHIPDLPSATQWTTAIDLTNRKFYYKTMYESSVQFVDVSESVNAISTEETFALDSGKFKPVKKNPGK